MPKNTSARVRKIICYHLGADLDATADDVLLSDMGADSLDRLEISMALEDAFHIVIHDDDADANISFDASIASVTAFIYGMVGR